MPETQLFIGLLITYRNPSSVKVHLCDWFRKMCVDVYSRIFFVVHVVDSQQLSSVSMHVTNLNKLYSSSFKHKHKVHIESFKGMNASIPGL